MGSFGNSATRMQLKVYRSLLGSSLSASSSIASSLASSLQVPKFSNTRYDGVVLTLDQLMELKLPVANRDYYSGDDSYNRNHPRLLRLICQLEPACADEASSQLVRLADHLCSYDGNNTTTNQQQQCPNPLQLDMVVVRAPSSVLFEDTPDDTEPATCLLEYLSSTLPEASQFLESIPPGSVHQIGRSNAHGNPLGQHIHGVTHHLTTNTAPTTDTNAATPPPVHLEQLSEIADIFPPTRFALDPTNLGSGNRTHTDGATRTANGHSSSPASSGAHGLSRELEGVVQNTDLLRVSPSTFQPPPLACTSTEGESRTNGHSDSDSDNDDPLPHGLFGAGTLFGEIWAAQELDGVRETYVICDQDNHDLTNTDTDTDWADSNTTSSTTNRKIDALAAKIHRAFDETEEWRAGAKRRREEEVEAAAADAAARRSKEGWLQGRYGPDAIESARVLGLLDDTVEDDDAALDTTLTKERIQRRWRTIAFQNHPDTADKSISVGGKESRNHLPFDVLKQHFQTLMEAVRHDEK